MLGVLPYLHSLRLDAEDALPLERSADTGFRIVVPALPRISNHTDFDALREWPGVSLRFAGPGDSLAPADFIILPGSKNTRADLAWLKTQGWDREIQRHLRYGGKLLGICGGFQMLGKVVRDPAGVESEPGEDFGLGRLDMETVLQPGKQLRNVEGRLASGEPVTGYEIHAGVSSGSALDRPLIFGATGESDGALSEDGQVAGTYWHGLFDRADARAALLRWAGWTGEARGEDLAVLRERELDRLADACEAHLDWPALAAIGGWS